jgi:hypothetical protein
MEAYNPSFPFFRSVSYPLGSLQQRVPPNQLKLAATVTWLEYKRGTRGRPRLPRLLEWNVWPTGKGEGKEELPTCCVCCTFCGYGGCLTSRNWQNWRLSVADCNTTSAVAKHANVFLEFNNLTIVCSKLSRTLLHLQKPRHGVRGFSKVVERLNYELFSHTGPVKNDSLLRNSKMS